MITAYLGCSQPSCLPLAPLLPRVAFAFAFAAFLFAAAAFETLQDEVFLLVDGQVGEVFPSGLHLLALGLHFGALLFTFSLLLFGHFGHLLLTFLFAFLAAGFAFGFHFGHLGVHLGKHFAGFLVQFSLGFVGHGFPVGILGLEGVHGTFVLFFDHFGLSS